MRNNLLESLFNVRPNVPLNGPESRPRARSAAQAQGADGFNIKYQTVSKRWFNCNARTREFDLSFKQRSNPEGHRMSGRTGHEWDESTSNEFVEIGGIRVSCVNLCLSEG
jgi:hypothetical protein